MPTWEEFKKNVKRTAKRAAKKTEELTDVATLKIKITNKEITRDGEYKSLGKLVYQKLKADENEARSLTQDISESIEKLDKCLAELSELESEYERLKSRLSTEKKSNSDAEKEYSAPSGEEIMEDFKRARAQGDDDLDTAKAEVERAREQAGKARLLAEQAAQDADDALELSMKALEESENL